MVSRRRRVGVLCLLLFTGVCLLGSPGLAVADIPMYTLIAPDEDVQILGIDRDTDVGVGSSMLKPAHVYPAVNFLGGLEALGVLVDGRLRASAGEFRVGMVRTRGSLPDNIPFVYSPATGVVNLIAGTEFNRGVVSAVNAAGRIAGSARIGGGPVGRAVSAPPGGVFTLLPVLSTLGALRGSTTSGINAAGVIVGFVRDDEAKFRPVAWPPEGGITVLGGEAMPPGAAIGINDSGVVIGTSEAPCTFEGWVLAADGVTRTMLQTLPGDTRARPADLNNAGLVVGISILLPPNCDGMGTQTAVIWEAGVVTKLLERVTNGDGWQLTSATGISHSGIIIGTGRLDGVARAFVLVPQPAAPLPRKPGPEQPVSPGRERSRERR